MPNTCSCLRASVLGFQCTEQPAMATRWSASRWVHVHYHFARSAAIRLGLSGAGPPLYGRLGPRMAPGLRGAFAAALPGPMYRITCPSRTQLHARYQVLAVRHGLMYRITGRYL